MIPESDLLNFCMGKTGLSPDIRQCHPSPPSPKSKIKMERIFAEFLLSGVEEWAEGGGGGEGVVGEGVGDGEVGGDDVDAGDDGGGEEVVDGAVGLGGNGDGEGVGVPVVKHVGGGLCAGYGEE